MNPLLFALAASFVPVDGSAALAQPGAEWDNTLNSHGKLVAERANRAFASGEFRADSMDADARNLACEAADLLRLELNVARLTPVAGLHVGMMKPRLEAAKADSALADSLYAGMDWAADSATQGGMFLARQLEAVWARVLEMAKPKLMGFKLFPINTDAPPGSENIKVTRFLDRGQAVIYNGGNTPIPTTALRQVATHVYFRHIVAAAQWSLFDQLAWDLSRINGIERHLATAKRVIEELWDKIIWRGSAEHGLYGIVNYPDINRRIVATTFSSSTNVDTMIREVQKLYTWVNETSNGAFLDNVMLFGTKLYNFLTGQRLGTNNDQSVMGYLKLRLQEIYEAAGGEGNLEFKAVARLNDVGGTGVHGIFVYQNDPDCISLPVSQPVTMLPLSQVDTTFRQVLYMTMAGVIMPNQGANLLGLVTLTS